MIPRTLFSSDHELFRDSVRKFLEQEAVPFHAQWEKDGHIDRQLWNKAGEAGMLCSHIPEEYGGMAADFLYSTVVIEEVGRLGLTGIGFSLHSDIVAPYILHYGTEAQKQYYLPKLVSGEMVTAIAMTEPGAGSDLQGVKTTAVLDGDEYVINGSKTFITNGFLADLVIVVAKTDPKAGGSGLWSPPASARPSASRLVIFRTLVSNWQKWPRKFRSVGCLSTAAWSCICRASWMCRLRQCSSTGVPTCSARCSMSACSYTAATAICGNTRWRAPGPMRGCSASMRVPTRS